VLSAWAGTASNNQRTRYKKDTFQENYSRAAVHVKENENDIYYTHIR